MSDEKKSANAKKTFKSLCGFLDNGGWRYDKDEAKLTIECSARGDDLPMKLNIRVNENRQNISLLSLLPFNVSEERRLDVAVAVSVINNFLVDGSFDYDIKGGHLFFRMNNSFIESDIGEDLFEYMVLCSFKTIDEYNDKLLALAAGTISLDKFLELIK